MAILRKGLSGEPVKRLQEKLGLTADGVFGPKTEDAVEAFQKANGLVVDGIAGPDTFTKMGLLELVLLSRGTSGETVKKLQTMLGITADGKFGPGTEKALKEWQAKNGLVADGMAGPRTIAAMKLIPGVDEDTIKAAAAPAGSTGADAPAGGTPAIPGVAGVQGEPPPAPANSVWGTIKGWFS
jgi:peptidoglycan hydrolase-like protein with peptidoglycan-binding domain